MPRRGKLFRPNILYRRGKASGGPTEGKTHNVKTRCLKPKKEGSFSPTPPRRGFKKKAGGWTWVLWGEVARGSLCKGSENPTGITGWQQGLAQKHRGGILPVASSLGNAAGGTTGKRGGSTGAGKKTQNGGPTWEAATPCREKGLERPAWDGWHLSDGQ